MAQQDDTKKKTKISIYLLKDDSKDEDFLTTKLTSAEIKGVGTVYKSQIPIDTPSWVDTFFDNKIDGLTKGGAGAILKVDMKSAGVTRHFLITFGYGFHKINLEACEERFGLKVVLNAGDLKGGVRSVDRKNISSTPKLSHEQMAKKEGITNFGIDYEQDMIQSLTLASTDEALGTTLTGGTALSITTAYTIHDIKALLPKLYEYYGSKKYIDEKYDWIDHVSDAPKSYISTLNSELLKRLNDHSEDNETCYLSPPELEDWTDILGFSPSGKKSDSIRDEIELDDYRRNRSGQLVTFDDIKQVKSRQVHLWSASNDRALKAWNLFRCIYTQVVLDERVFILSNGKWYEVNQNYSKTIDDWYSNLSIENSKFADYTKVSYTDPKTGESKAKHSEEAYNKKVAGTDYFCLDRKLIDLGPRKDIEACDLYKPGEFMHIKIFTGSSAPISHLLAQATVSADLFFGEREFRNVLNDKLSGSFKLNSNELESPTQSNYKISLGIITNKQQLELPFFSRVNLRSALRRLETMGLEVKLVRINAKF